MSELDHLAVYLKALLETLTDPTLLIQQDGLIEYMNPCAQALLQESNTPSGRRAVQIRLQPVLADLTRFFDPPNPPLVKIGQHSFSCQIGQFVGSKGDCLHWLILRSPSADNSHCLNPKGSFPAGPVIIGRSRAMKHLQNQAVQVSQTDVTVLITGESGTGKELVARQVHRNSARSDRTLLALNCTTFNDELLANELFGHEKGAFTGAALQTKGKFETADGGTLFLDEIGDISPRMQAALLRVLESGEIVRVGGNTPISVNVRVIAATAINLPQAVREKRFRLDLYYRLNTLCLNVPPLREHREDIVELAEYFFARYSKAFRRTIQFNPETVKAKLESYDWPGNVRELQSVIQRAVLMTRTGIIANDDLALDGRSIRGKNHSPHSALLNNVGDVGLKEILEQVEREVIQQKLAKYGGNVANTAQALNISKAVLYDKMRRHNISAKALR